jgi:hypothetical protein
MIEVEGLTVRFAGVTPIDGMSVTFPGGTAPGRRRSSTSSPGS